MSTLKDLSSNSARETFNKKVLSAVPHLHPYVKHRLIVAEVKGILPRNMYTSNGIIDDGIAKMYEDGYDIDLEAMAIKLKLFHLVDEMMNDLMKKEAFHKDTISTDHILKQELSRLNEDFTMDADNDLILNTELNDISYHQKDVEHMFVYNDMDSTILSEFEIKDLSAGEGRQLLGKFYNWLPMQISNIIDLYNYGKLNFEDISQIMNIEVERIQKIFNAVKKQFRRHLE